MVDISTMMEVVGKGNAFQAVDNQDEIALWQLERQGALIPDRTMLSSHEQNGQLQARHTGLH